MSERPTQNEIVRDSECLQGKCACPTTGCVGTCQLKANASHEREVVDADVLRIAKDSGAVLLMEMNDRYWQKTGGATFQAKQLQDFTSKLRVKDAADLQVARGQYQGACDVIKQLEATIALDKEIQSALRLSIIEADATIADLRTRLSGQTCFVPPEFQKELDEAKATVAQLKEDLQECTNALRAKHHAWKESQPELSASQEQVKMLRLTGAAIIDDLVIRARLAEDDSLNVSDSILQAFEQALAATAPKGETNG